ncbi:hypothetical protein FAZ97_25880 [Paraburkholderia acidiphila]|uniref:Uncharacterized protein n=1 Tax=Paraburkholderia acidiphila TaxID=2571747 RepID=A0A7Z2GB64_9BURK|nr:hypothetical protein FAZ97_25880 [Paraburkholderia acidiphila]
MATLHKVWRLIAGAPLDPLDPRTRHAIAVTPLLAWVGLGADGLSSSCYGRGRVRTLTRRGLFRSIT